MRSIDADAYIERINKTFNESPCCKSVIGEALAYVVLKGIEGDLKNESKTPTIDITQRWIPVSERLPNIDEWVLTSEDTGCVWIQSLWKNHDGSLEWDYEGLRTPFEAVLAWMPLPEPYEVFDGEMNPKEE